ncbi:acyltransferase ChoActase/COT/CPT [Sistotremastrum suecicum HHB10207 ss-3]|uniref:Carnitine O-acetyltransferase, mitochondrial n=1 Tax=Sistotremastrum suecicum HHB10207 ss-3 TaxID=1314776 RepID=A0A165ZJX2_9AGAM|nr:acyltransferase ChoActase/COT/CPT [Sistotremastrum suecicum HHB10207 ss-3]
MARNKQIARRSSTKPAAELPPGYAIDPSLGPMLQYQRSLPHLPVPTLSSTASKYLETVRPHLTANEYKDTEKAVDEFVKSPLATELQERLKARANQPGTVNWLADWWNDVAYMGYRDPVVVFVSYFYVHVDGNTKSQARRAAELIKSMLPFKHLVETQQLAPEKVKGVPICMDSYQWLFNSSRYPVIPSDTAKKFDPSQNNHVILVRKNKFFEVPIVHEGQELSTQELESQVAKVIELAGNDKGAPIGVLTSENRDIWTEARKALLAASPQNAQSLERIESSIIIVPLDDTTPQTREDNSWTMWTGDGRNRFYDKHQLIVCENGRSGFLGEHSCMDGTPTLRLNEFMLHSLAQNKVSHGTSSRTLPAPVELKFTLDPSSQKFISEAEKHFDTLIGAHDLYVLQYEKYGKNLIKKYGVSPDAWTQLIKQLAFHKLFGRPGVCYESAQTRKFQRGRTEVIRAASNESKAWAEAMLDSSQSNEERFKLFKQAAVRHVQYAAWAADGQGVDRHLFGLKKLLKEGEDVPNLYTDKAYSKTNHWELSTSQLSSPYFDGWGYGEVVEDGYGLAYAIGDDHLRWTITSLKRDTAKLRDALEWAADETRKMAEAVGPQAKPKPKL